MDWQDLQDMANYYLTSGKLQMQTGPYPQMGGDRLAQAPAIQNAQMHAPVDPMSVAAGAQPAESMVGGLSSAAKGDLLNQIINQRHSVYHNTDIDRALSILEQGQIKPGSLNRGVSVSRVPAIPTFNKGVTFELDPTKTPNLIPTAESSFAKTTTRNRYWGDEATEAEHLKYNDLAQKYSEAKTPEDKDAAFSAQQNLVKTIQKRIPSVPNKDFEYESRTQNQPISLDAIKAIRYDPMKMDENSLMDFQRRLGGRSQALEPIDRQLSAKLLDRVTSTQDLSRQLINQTPPPNLNTLMQMFLGGR